MKKYPLIVQVLVSHIFLACVAFTSLICWTHYRGGYQFWDSVYLAGGGSLLAGIYSYWKAWHKNGGDPYEETVLLKTHSLLVRSLRTGLGVACAVFTFLIVLAHFQGAYEFWEIFYLAAGGGVAAGIEGYRRALRKLADEETEPA